MVVVLGLIAVGRLLRLQQILGIGGYDDYSGKGESEVVVQVKNGQSTGDIAATLADADVVASSRAFVAAAETDERVRAIQPGYYVVKTKSSGSAAVEPDRRQGGEGREPADHRGHAAGRHQERRKVTPGIVSELAQASCATLNGKSTCVKADAAYWRA